MNAALAPTPGLVRCPACALMLAGPWAEREENPRQCGRCGNVLHITVFPALQTAGQLLTTTGALALDGEATCFFHPEKRAERACDRCGRFLCALCDLPLGARHLCPSCLKLNDQRAPLPELVSSRTSWGRLSLLLALIPCTVIFWFAFVITGPAAIFAALYGWNRPGSLVNGQRHISATFGLLLGLVQVGLLVAFIYNVWKGATHRAL